MGDKIKVQHYVPQFYLRHFSVKGKGNYLYCFDKFGNSVFRVNRRNIACESYFYDTPGDEEQEIEKILSSCESFFKLAYEKLIRATDLSALTYDDKVSIALFMTIQEWRTRENRARIEDMVTQIISRLSKEELSEELKQQLRIDELGTEEGVKSFHVGLLKNAPKYAEILCKMKWFLTINRTEMPYWTSDHPVNRYNPIDMSPRGNLGLLCRGIEIHFPLTPKISLCICDPSIYGHLPGRYETRDIQHIYYGNSLQVTGSTRYVFSVEEDFSLAKRIIRDHPLYADIQRRRLSVE